MGSDEREPTDQDRSLREMDEADLESARERALENADDETVQLIDEELQAREQEEQDAQPDTDRDAQPDQSAQGSPRRRNVDQSAPGDASADAGRPIPGTTPTTRRSLEALEAVEQVRETVERRRQARSELNLGSFEGDPAPEIDARRHDRNPEIDESDPDPEVSLWLPAWITIPLLLTLPFGLAYGPKAFEEFFRYGTLLTVPHKFILPFLLALGTAVWYYLKVLLTYFYRSYIG